MSATVPRVADFYRRRAAYRLIFYTDFFPTYSIFSPIRDYKAEKHSRLRLLYKYGYASTLRIFSLRFYPCIRITDCNNQTQEFDLIRYSANAVYQFSDYFFFYHKSNNFKNSSKVIVGASIFAASTAYFLCGFTSSFERVKPFIAKPGV